ncbi:MAG: hypothetical protein K1X88_01970 [Nannocystaceae bacterium]|nr:hypothetical protein [Nannocystaceae bacterium]
MRRRSRLRSAERGLAVVVALACGCIVVDDGELGAAGSTDRGTDTGAAAVGVSGPAGEADGGGDELPPLALDIGAETGGASPPPPPHNRGDCCTVAAALGCVDADIEACVCAADPYCCTDGWDELCVDHVATLSCGSCAGASADARTIEGCCAAHDTPACADDVVAQCVCASEPFCCAVAWDELCVDAIATLGCGECNPRPVADPTCCTPANEPGCIDPDIAACVCAIDAYCCDTQWDELCVDELASYGCGSCGDVGGSSDGGGSSSSSGGSSSGGSGYGSTGI